MRERAHNIAAAALYMAGIGGGIAPLQTWPDPEPHRAYGPRPAKGKSYPFSSTRQIERNKCQLAAGQIHFIKHGSGH